MPVDGERLPLRSWNFQPPDEFVKRPHRNQRCSGYDMAGLRLDPLVMCFTTFECDRSQRTGRVSCSILSDERETTDARRSPRLISEQLEALREKLEPTEAVRYADRKRRIAELLDRVSRLES